MLNFVPVPVPDSIKTEYVKNYSGTHTGAGAKIFCVVCKFNFTPARHWFSCENLKVLKKNKKIRIRGCIFFCV